MTEDEADAPLNKDGSEDTFRDTERRLRAKLTATASGYSEAYVTKLRAEIARLREAIEKAPCADGSRHDPQVCPYDSCNCWKATALKRDKP